MRAHGKREAGEVFVERFEAVAAGMIGLMASLLLYEAKAQAEGEEPVNGR